jgi:hypothetical protein
MVVGVVGVVVRNNCGGFESIVLRGIAAFVFLVDASISCVCFGTTF